MDPNHPILTSLHVNVVGAGDRFVILSHGFGTNQSSWRGVLHYLQQRFRVILYDLACSGSVNTDSFDFNRYHSLNGYVDDLLLILDSLGVHHCAFVGHSMSSMIGILASVRRPHFFTKLVLVAASPRYLNDETYQLGFESEVFEQVYESMTTNYTAWVNNYAPLAVGGDYPSAILEFSRTLFDMRPDISLFVLRTVFDSDVRDVLRLVQVPCCMVQSARDPGVPAEVATYLRNHLGGRSTIEMLNAEGHLPQLSAPFQLADVLLRTLLEG